MAAILAPPDKEYEPRRKRWTRQECAKLVEFGFLQGRYELIDGEIIEKMGQGWLHSYVVSRLTTLFATLFGGLLRVQLPMMVPDDTNEPEPDMAVTEQPDTAYQGRHPDATEMVLVVEVADSSLAFDLSVKARLYASAGVQDYWVMDTNGRRLYVHRNPSPEGYQNVTVHAETETVSLLLRSDASVRIADLLPAPDERITE